jgi:hypothetical protein
VATALSFTNLKDDNERLNLHTKAIIAQLNDKIDEWTRAGFDARAISSALSMYHVYYQVLGQAKLGQPYMTALYLQAEKLAEALLKKHKQLTNIVR